MIEINLIPPELRKKKKGMLLGGMQIPLEVIVGSAGGLFVLLICFHILLLIVNVNKLKTHKELQAHWAQILPQKENVDGIINDMRKLQNKHKEVIAAVNLSDIRWAEKINLISQDIPRGVWLNKVALNNYIFYLDGSAIARGGNEMINVHSFTSNLKGDKRFMEHFVELEVGSIQTRTVDRTDIADFLITLKLEGFSEDEY